MAWATCLYSTQFLNCASGLAAGLKALAPLGEPSLNQIPCIQFISMHGNQMQAHKSTITQKAYHHCIKEIHKRVSRWRQGAPKAASFVIRGSLRNCTFMNLHVFCMHLDKLDAWHLDTYWAFQASTTTCSIQHRDWGLKTNDICKGRLGTNTNRLPLAVNTSYH